MYKIKDEVEKIKEEPEFKDTNKKAFKFLIVSLIFIVLAVILVIVLCFIK